MDAVNVTVSVVGAMLEIVPEPPTAYELVASSHAITIFGWMCISGLVPTWLYPSFMTTTVADVREDVTHTTPLDPPTAFLIFMRLNASKHWSNRRGSTSPTPPGPPPPPRSPHVAFSSLPLATP